MTTKEISKTEMVNIAACKLQGHRIFNYRNIIICRTCNKTIATNGKHYTGELQE